MQPLRWQADAALTGVDTVLADDPMLTDRSGLRRRRPAPAHCPRLRPAHAARLEDGDLRKQRRRHLHRLKRRSASTNSADRGVRVEVLPAEAGRVPLGKVLDQLGKEGILTVLTETGTRLNTALLAGGLVDRVHLFVSPQIMGSDAVPAFRGIANPIRMADVEVERYGNDLGLCSLLKDPWPPEQNHKGSDDDLSPHRICVAPFLNRRHLFTPSRPTVQAHQNRVHGLSLDKICGVLVSRDLYGRATTPLCSLTEADPIKKVGRRSTILTAFGVFFVLAFDFPGYGKSAISARRQGSA